MYVDPFGLGVCVGFILGVAFIVILAVINGRSNNNGK